MRRSRSRRFTRLRDCSAGPRAHDSSGPFVHRITRSPTWRWSAEDRDPRPGEISLAHHGVLFLDEMAEFNRTCSRSFDSRWKRAACASPEPLRTVVFPARFMLIGAMNPCPCGYHGDEVAPVPLFADADRAICVRLSGPLRDRMDLTVSVAALPARELSAAVASESSAVIRIRVETARARQIARDGKLNARLQGRPLRARTPLDREARRMFDLALSRLALTARGHDRVLRVARTIADLHGSDRIGRTISPRRCSSGVTDYFVSSSALRASAAPLKSGFSVSARLSAARPCASLPCFNCARPRWYW